MNSRRLRLLCALTVLITLTSFAFAVRVGGTAPDFTGIDTNGKTHKLSDFHGKYVVLEWTNNGCPIR